MIDPFQLCENRNYTPIKMISNQETSPSLENELSKINKKKDRIDALVIIAKQKFDRHESYYEIMKNLEFLMSVKWALSPSSKTEYLRTIVLTFQDKYNVKLEPTGDNDIEKINGEIVRGKSEKKLAKTDLFIRIMKTLEGNEKTPVKESIIVNELEKIDKFTNEAETLIRKMLHQSIIYESKPSHYNLV